MNFFFETVNVNFRILRELKKQNETKKSSRMLNIIEQ